MIITDAAIKNRATVGVLIVLIVFIGTWSYMTLPREGPPDVAIPIILVTTSYKGVSPEDVTPKTKIAKYYPPQKRPPVNMIEDEFPKNIEVLVKILREKEKVI